MNRHPSRHGSCAPLKGKLQSFRGTVLPDLALASMALLMPAAFAQGAALSFDAKPAIAVGQVDAVLTRATVVAPPSSGPTRAEVLPQVQKELPRPRVLTVPTGSPARAETVMQLYPALPRSALVATALPKATGIQALVQPSVAARLALQAPALQPGQGTESTDNSIGPASCSGADKPDCQLPQDPKPDWQTTAAVEIDPVSGAALVPGVTWNPTRAPYKLDEVLTHLASAGTRPRLVWVTPSSPGTGFGADPVGLDSTTTVDLGSANEASYVTGLTPAGYTRVLITAAAGSTLQLNNITLSAGTPAALNSLRLSSALNGSIAVFGGSTQGSGFTQVATIKSLSVEQSGAADVVSLGLNGTTGTVTTVLQSGSGVKTLQLDNFTNDMVTSVKQSGNAAQSATGIVLKAAPHSLFVLVQQ